jgi:predicted nucleic acid-binding protein
MFLIGLTAMPKNRIFIDTNIWIYFFTEENDIKCKISKEFITENMVKSSLIVSYQVINEMSKILKIKKKFSEQRVCYTIEYLAKFCKVQNYSTQAALLASQFRQNYSFSFWDSHIAASAVMARCDYLISEDMQNGFTINNTKNYKYICIIA